MQNKPEMSSYQLTMLALKLEGTVYMRTNFTTDEQCFLKIKTCGIASF